MRHDRLLGARLANVPDSIEVLELCREFGLGFNVWLMPVGEPYSQQLARQNFNDGWTVPLRAHQDDLLLFYRTKPEHAIVDLFRIAGHVTLEPSGLSRRDIKRTHRGWHAKEDHFAPIRRVCRLKAPVFYEDLKNHRVLSSAGFVRAQMRRRYNVSDYWPYLYNLIISRNIALRNCLAMYQPARLGTWK